MSQIARDSGISLSHISKISGGTRNPSLPVLAAMSDALGCEEQDIIEAIGWGGHGKAKAA
jgi:transcriptional regulator with XRE-family HTH domain